ncbi:MAG: tRNA (adenosine(37)-N6)-dimethylallyltransferase MiaA [Elusimicrobiaceae bacterium]|nr:tRNA (adenosine(37)-N6)-dimethylallyltransferase MiaA [Elusimicrobiaceae bacterium]
MKPIVLCGPTASGKTELALALARQTGGIIISADSRQVYKRLTIGTAKPQGSWQDGAYRVEGVPYYLVDFLDITDVFNAGAFCARAKEIARAHPDTQLIFAGGTGMYLHAYFVGMDELPPGTPASRATVEKILQEEGKEGLHARLKEKDPASAEKIPVGNVQRTMRALELFLLTGQPASTLKSGRFFKLPDERQSHWVYLDWEKETLAKRIQTRTEQIFDGMVEETRQLLREGFPPQTPGLKSLGYPQAVEFLAGKLDRATAIEHVCTLTRQYAKRQRTWFNRYTQAKRICLNTSDDFKPAQLSTEILAAHKKSA